ncbi:Scr1 family TA system antitoxin-like transcriptional regulator [Streptomyces marincola]|uniref:DUF5753 domain-containing protein n=1 Tax=Streptomyces marincola TaxID=2878388 RepID=A0A1W7CTT7_9ACTN|nr:hypothetical protein CAG99_02205 [Streptomyces marincola]
MDEHAPSHGLTRLGPWDALFLTYEAEATRCMEYQPLLIPGQLQTEGYATAITGPGFAPLSPDLRSSGRRVV